MAEVRYRPFGRTGAQVSERAFGAWAIGGTAWGRVDRADALGALARAEEFGVNLVDTAAVYGDSEAVLGEFLKGRRDRWVVASKYSGQPQGLTALVEEQLRRLGTSWIDFYQIHWVPREPDDRLYDELLALKESGKVRWVGVSLYTEADIDHILSRDLDGFQVAFSLLDPRPLVSRLPAVEAAGLGVLVRSVLKGGFLTGKYGANATFSGSDDQRSDWTRARIARTAKNVERFRFLEREAGTLLRAAIGYPLAFPVSSVLLSAKNAQQAGQNFGEDTVGLTESSMERIHTVQSQLGLLRDPMLTRVKAFLRSVVRMAG